MTDDPALGPEELDRLFPWHFVLDRALALRRAGPSLGRICSRMRAGVRLTDVVSIHRPALSPSFEAIAGSERELFVLEVHDPPLRLRGQFVPMHGGASLLFAGSPWFTDGATLRRLGLTFRDFALQDPLIDLLQVLQAQRTGFQDLQELTARLEVRNRALREAEELTRSVVETAPDAVVSMDACGVIIACNAASEQLFGWDRSELVGRPVHTLVPDEDRLREWWTSEATSTPGRAIGWGREALLARRDGTCFVADIRLGTAELDERRVLTAFVHDRTEADRAEEALRRAKETAEIASQHKAVFLANMSHEIRTPMTAVIGMTDILASTDLDPQQREYLSVIRSSGKALLAIINDILDLTKIESGALEIRSEAVDLMAILNEALDLVGALAADKGLALAGFFPPDLCSRGRMDGTRLGQVLANLLSNACKFTEKGSVRVDVTAQPLVDDTWCYRFGVHDTGGGIPADRMEEIFGAFRQLDESSTRAHGGTGLGLAISRQLAEAMGGRLWYESEPGRGSSFYVEVPVSDVEPGVEARLTTNTHAFRGRTCLIASSDPLDPAWLRSWLEPLGIVARFAADARGLGDVLAEGQRPDLVFWDENVDPGAAGAGTRAALHDEGVPVVELGHAGGGGRFGGREPSHLRLSRPLKPMGLREILVRAWDLPEESSVREAGSEIGLAITLGRHVLVVEDQAVNRRVTSTLLRQLGHTVDVAADGQEGDRGGSTHDLRPRPDGRTDAGDGRDRSHAPDPRRG